MDKRIIKIFLGIVRSMLVGVKIPRGGIYIGRNVHVSSGKKIQIGSLVQIRPYCDLFAGDVFIIGNNCDIGTRTRIAGKVVICDDVLIGPDVFICSYDHSYKDINTPVIKQHEYEPCRNGHQEIKIGSGTWIGIHSVISGDVHIGKHCIVGANSVVTKDISDYCVVAGNPAKIIKRYNAETEKWERV